MASSPRVVPVSDDEYERQKAEVAARCVNATVVGVMPIRDAVSRESIQTGGTVRLDPETTMIAHLVNSGAIRLLPAQEKTAAKPSEG